MTRNVTGAIATLLFALCAPVGAKNDQPTGSFQTTSLLGRKLYALPDDGTVAAAQKALAADSKNATLALNLSKAQAARRQYREAIATCNAAIKMAPNNADLYLERGHRELGLREFKPALADLNRAAALDPTLLDTQYHLALAHYFLGEFPQAAEAFKRGLDMSKTTDSVIDYSNWLYAALRRAGQTEAAAEVLKRITPEMKNTGPHLYFYLRLLRFYQGVLPENELLPPAPTGPTDIEGELSFNTINYGVGNWHRYTNTDAAHANEYFSRVVKGYAWNSWGFIGSELALTKDKH